MYCSGRVGQSLEPAILVNHALEQSRDRGVIERPGVGRPHTRQNFHFPLGLIHGHPQFVLDAANLQREARPLVEQADDDCTVTVIILVEC